MRKKMKKRERIFLEEKNKLKNEYIDWVKRVIIQEVSLIRNLQYDIDFMIKQTNVFEIPPFEDSQNLSKISKIMK
jgi:hypothetical protein